MPPFLVLWERLLEDMERYDETKNVIVVVQVNGEDAGGNELVWNYLVDR